VANIASYLASQRGHRTLAIDMDPQGQLGKVLGVEARPARRSAIALLVDQALGVPAEPGPEPDPAPGDGALPVLATRIPRLDVIAANKSLALFPAWSTTHEGVDPTERLARRLASAPELEGYDYVLVDAPPSFGPLTLNILRACEEVVVPVPLTYLALDGCAELMRTLELVRTRYGNRDLRVSMVVPTFHRRTRLAREILGRLEERFPRELAETVVGFHVKIDEAQSRSLSIFEYAPRDKGAACMAALAEELERRGDPAGDERAAGPRGPETPPRPRGLPAPGGVERPAGERLH